MLALVPTGSPETLTQLGHVEAPVPGEDEALVKVSDFSLNRADFLYLNSPSSNFRPGIDAAGIVEVPAADGGSPPAGTRVVLHLPSGGGAEYVVASADRMTEIPDGVPTHLAAAIPLAGLVAQRLLAVACAGARIVGVTPRGPANHRDPVMTYHLPGGDRGCVATVRPATPGVPKIHKSGPDTLSGPHICGQFRAGLSTAP